MGNQNNIRSKRSFSSQMLYDNLQYLLAADARSRRNLHASKKALRLYKNIQRIRNQRTTRQAILS